MLIKNYQLVFLRFLIIGTVISISSNSWFLAWIGLEINLISIIPLFVYKIDNNSTESSIKYFLPQAIASVAIILCASIDIAVASYRMFSFTHLILTSALMIKLGLPPFHFWFPQIINKMSWSLCIVIISWQKLAPFMLISTILINPIISPIIIITALIGAMGGFNQNLTKLIITYSSVSHGAWILPLIIFSTQNWIFYFLIYCLISFSLIYMLKIYNILKTSNLSNLHLPNNSKITIILILISLGGLPPLLGFIAKLNAIITILNFSGTPILLVLISSSLVSLFYYIKLTYSITTIFPFKPLKYLKTLSNPIILSAIIYISILGNTITPLIISLI